MSFSLIHSRSINGTNSPPVDVEVHLSNGLPAFTIVGLPETAVKESRDRVRSAIINSNYLFPSKKITVNLAPADLPKEGARFDLPIAIGILAASGQLNIDKDRLKLIEFIGELSLDGQIRAVSGTLPTAHMVKKAGHQLALSTANLTEAGLINKLKLYCSVSLTGLIETIMQQNWLDSNNIPKPEAGPIDYLDFADVKGQSFAKRALEVVAAGGHNLLMMGPPGCGKTMLASRLAGIMPQLTETQSIETASLYSISRSGFELKNWRRTPVRSPHHSCSPVALIGGGSKPTPGEISLAHNGVLYLDELPEFDSRALEMLREPLETGYVNIARVNHSQQYKANIILIASCNPCRCGYFGTSSRQQCRCTPAQINHYRNKLSGPLLDRFDMHVDLAAVPACELVTHEKSEGSSVIAERVSKARSIQFKRQSCSNSALGVDKIRDQSIYKPQAIDYLTRIAQKLTLTARSFHRVLKVARTISDCDGVSDIEKRHINEALHYRSSIK